MAKYYFTYEGDRYGTHKGAPRKQFFRGGWTEVEADSERSARMAYYAAHPEVFDAEVCGHDACLTEEWMHKFGHFEKGINGYKCVERITVMSVVLERGAVNA